MNSTTEWILIRATGLTAVVLLSASMILGLMLSLRVRSRRWPAVVTNDLHRYVTGLALWVMGTHLALLVLDSYVTITLRDLVVPFVADTRTLTTGLGTIAFITMSVIWFTSINRDRIGRRTWRSLHYLTFIAYVLAMAHGVFGGTDTRQIWAWPLYATSLIAVGGLTWRRIRTARGENRAPRPAPITRPATRTVQPGAARMAMVAKAATPRQAPAATAHSQEPLPPLDRRPDARRVGPARRGPVRL